MKKINKTHFFDEDYPDYIFFVDDDNKITAYRQITPYIMGSRNILHFNLKKGDKRHAISEARILAAAKQLTPIDERRYISNKTTNTYRRQQRLVELITAREEICAEHPRLTGNALWDDAIESAFNSCDIASNIEAKKVLIKHLCLVTQKSKKEVQLEQAEHKLSTD